jgi:hypothetical protein
MRTLAGSTRSIDRHSTRTPAHSGRWGLAVQPRHSCAPSQAPAML